jgi:hypothetical protein
MAWEPAVGEFAHSCVLPPADASGLEKDMYGLGQQHHKKRTVTRGQ